MEKRFMDLAPHLRDTTILLFTGSLLKQFIKGDEKDIDNIPSNIYNDLIVLTNNRHPQSQKDLTPSARDRLLERVSHNIQLHAMSTFKNTTYGPFYTAAFYHKGWIRAVELMDPTKM